jgi:hypothetical protein
MSALNSLQCGMPTLTRRRYPERPNCWHVYNGDVHVGTISERAGAPIDADRWGWHCGFYPRADLRISERSGTAADFETARAKFGAAWEEYLPTCSEADFEKWRDQRDFTAEKYAARDRGEKISYR